MSSLAQLQHALQRHIVEGDESIASSIDSSAEVPAATRLKIYSDAYRLRLIEALQANFPILEKVIGADQFARVSQLYLSMHPSRHFSIRWFGHELAGFLREVDEYRDQPWLAELAEWEWKIAAAFDAENAPLLAIEDVAGLAPESWPELNMKMHPSVQRIRLHSNVHAIVNASNEDNSPLPRPMTLEASEWLIWRQALTVNYRSLDPLECAALDAVIEGANFGAMCEQLSEHIDAEDVPLKAASFLKTWIDSGVLAK